MNENIKGRFIRLLPVAADVASLRSGEIWVKASAINRIEVLGPDRYSIQAGLEYLQCSNDPFALLAEMDGEPV